MKALIASTTLALLSVFAPAQDANEESLAAAARLIETMGVREEMSNTFKAVIGQSMQPMIKQMGLNPAQAKELNVIFSSWWEDDIDQEAMITEMTGLYAETFTTAELTELELFYETPLGRKLLLTTPELTQKGMKIGMTAAQSKQPALMAKMKAFQESLDEDEAPQEEDDADAEVEDQDEVEAPKTTE